MRIQACVVALIMVVSSRLDGNANWANMRFAQAIGRCINGFVKSLESFESITRF
jgi:hypothetical protein